ncbi:hypothetical protein [uncultured Microbulbifer sp.]|nr:hypothetical protein [uncultured Microbulbifer sp.]
MKVGKVQACLPTANHQNSTGYSISSVQNQQLGWLANQYSIPIIEDDVF